MQRATIEIIGRLNENPKSIGRLKDGSPIVGLLVAVQKSGKTDYYRVTTWRSLATACMDNLAKGDLVQVSGDVRTSTYEKDGVKCRGLEVSANDVTFLGGEQ